MKPTNYARYWRNSLADAELGSGALTEKEAQAFTGVDKQSFQDGRLPATLIEELFKRESEQTTKIAITYRPKVLRLKQHHGKTYDGLLPAIVSPLICPLQLTREGDLLPSSPAFVPRDLLAPLDNFKLTVGSVDDLDKFLTNHQVPVVAEINRQSDLSDEELQEKDAQWQDYLNHCETLYQQVCLRLLSDTETLACYLVEESDYLIKSKQVVGAATHILKLYDGITSSAPKIPLFNHYAECQITDRQPCYPMEKTVTLRLGHASDQYALADAQRDALSHTLLMKEGDILAVNGPPGTGKTTFLLSAVASLWVEAALTESDPPIIVAASTNNQAVTNIIHAFGKDFSEGDSPLSGRWLPEIDSYGGYFPARSNEKEASVHYQTPAFYEQLESQDYVEQAEAFFLQKAQQALADLSTVNLTSVLTALHLQLVDYQRQLQAIEDSWKKYCSAKKQMHEVLGETPQKTLSDIQAKADQQQKLSQTLAKDSHQLLDYLADEPLWLTLFAWLPIVRDKRSLKRRRFIQETLSQEGKAVIKQASFSQYEQRLQDTTQQFQHEHQQLLQDLTHKQQFLTRYQQAKETWLQRIHRMFGENEGECLSLDACDKQADTRIRFIMFRLAVHYWEARWLLECQTLGKQLETQRKKTGRKSVEPRWKRRMMLTPCIVSTFHALPSHFTCQLYEDGSYQTDYLYNFIDLLFVDEAGQVSPEVAGASFALAKKALVIGDVHQIEPVRSLSGAIDVGNLLQAGITTTLEDYEAIQQSGRSVVSGSVMHIAQAASQFHALPKMEPGLFLREHRRCYDNIIAFCNDLCYQGALLPKRGPSPKDNTFPAVGYLHIDGKAVQSKGGSRKNILEAETIAAWLAEHQETLQTLYKMPISASVGIVTPFSAQAYEISKACQHYGIKAGRGKDQLTVGTVHALQGAERKLIIFSPVYSRHNDGGFIDSSRSMLNVAVSRAKDSFLVFGDMDVIAAATINSPRNLLAKYLFSDPANELIFTLQQRSDLIQKTTAPQLINDAKQHDEYLYQCLRKAAREIHIVSPWISLSKLQDTGLLEALAAAVQRGINITIYADKHFNTTVNNTFDKRAENAFQQCCKTLQTHNIRTFVVNGVHSKLLMTDHCSLCVGSFNWFSAARRGKYANLETSLAYQGELVEEIQLQIKYLQKRADCIDLESPITNSEEAIH